MNDRMFYNGEPSSELGIAYFTLINTNFVTVGESLKFSVGQAMFN